MATDTLTVEAARQELEMRITDGLMDDTVIAHAIDALIAAVRAEPLSFDQRAEWFKAGRLSAFDWLVQQAIATFPGRYTSPTTVSLDEQDAS